MKCMPLLARFKKIIIPRFLAVDIHHFCFLEIMLGENITYPICAFFEFKGGSLLPMVD